MRCAGGAAAVSDGSGSAGLGGQEEAEGRKERRVLGTTHGSCHAPHQSKKRADRPFARAALRVRNAASGSASADRTYL